MNFLSATLLSLSAALSAASPAIAQQEMQRGRDFAQGRRAAMARGLPGHNEQSRDGGGQQTLSNKSPGQLEAEPSGTRERAPGQGHERLSPEERRQLQRDINAAGRDIYRRPRGE